MIGQACSWVSLKEFEYVKLTENVSEISIRDSEVRSVQGGLDEGYAIPTCNQVFRNVIFSETFANRCSLSTVMII